MISGKWGEDREQLGTHAETCMHIALHIIAVVMSYWPPVELQCSNRLSPCCRVIIKSEALTSHFTNKVTSELETRGGGVE